MVHVHVYHIMPVTPTPYKLFLLQCIHQSWIAEILPAGEFIELAGL